MSISSLDDTWEAPTVIDLINEKQGCYAEVGHSARPYSCIMGGVDNKKSSVVVNSNISYYFINYSDIVFMGCFYLET